MDEKKLDEFLGLAATAVAETPEAYDGFGFLPEGFWGENEPEGHRSCEEGVALAAIQYPALHPKMAQIVESLSRHNHKNGPLWVSSEEHAGGVFARELALADKQYVPLFARFLSTNDLDHEVYQHEDVEDIYAKWGPCKETYAMLAARRFTPGQYGEDFPYRNLAKTMGDESEANAVVGAMADWFLEKWCPRVHAHPIPFARRIERTLHSLFTDLFAEFYGQDEDGIAYMVENFIYCMENDLHPSFQDLLRGPFEEVEPDLTLIGCFIETQSKRTLETVVLNYDEDKPLLEVTYGFAKQKLIEYDSPAALLQAVASFEAWAKEQNLYWDKTTTPGFSRVEHISARKKRNAPVPIQSFYATPGKKTFLDKHWEKVSKGTPQVPCHKLQFYKGPRNHITYYCDVPGRRILKIRMGAFDPKEQYIEALDNAEAFEARLIALRKKHTAKGYELVVDEPLGYYAFDAALEGMKQAFAQLS